MPHVQSMRSCCVCIYFCFHIASPPHFVSAPLQCLLVRPTRDRPSRCDAHRNHHNSKKEHHNYDKTTHTPPPDRKTKHLLYTGWCASYECWHAGCHRSPLPPRAPWKQNQQCRTQPRKASKGVTGEDGNAGRRLHIIPQMLTHAPAAEATSQNLRVDKNFSVCVSPQARLPQVFYHQQATSRKATVTSPAKRRGAWRFDLSRAVAQINDLHLRPPCDAILAGEGRCYSRSTGNIPADATEGTYRRAGPTFDWCNRTATAAAATGYTTATAAASTNTVTQQATQERGLPFNFVMSLYSLLVHVTALDDPNARVAACALRDRLRTIAALAALETARKVSGLRDTPETRGARSPVDPRSPRTAEELLDERICRCAGVNGEACIAES